MSMVRVRSGIFLKMTISQYSQVLVGGGPFSTVTCLRFSLWDSYTAALGKDKLEAPRTVMAETRWELQSRGSSFGIVHSELKPVFEDTGGEPTNDLLTLGTSGKLCCMTLSIRVVGI
jgi:hypothetical protein